MTYVARDVQVNKDLYDDVIVKLLVALDQSFKSLGLPVRGQNFPQHQSNICAEPQEQHGPFSSTFDLVREEFLQCLGWLRVRRKNIQYHGGFTRVEGGSHGR